MAETHRIDEPDAPRLRRRPILRLAGSSVAAAAIACWVCQTAGASVLDPVLGPVQPSSPLGLVASQQVVQGLQQAELATPVDPLAAAYTPRIVEDSDDGFMPTSWFVTPDLAWAGDQTRLCLVTTCGATLAGRQLPPNQGLTEDLRFPARDNVPNERKSFADAINTLPSFRPPAIYYFRTPKYADGSFVIRYWIYYTFNWFNANGTCGPCGGLTHDLHEADWEHIDVRFNASSQPLRVRLSEHMSYYPISWAAIQKAGTHLVTYAARGDHANYPHTGAWRLTLPEIGVIGFTLLNGASPFDYIGVRHATVAYNPAPPRVGDLAGRSALANFSCWAGRMGEQFSVGLVGDAWGKSPGSPLAQSRDLPGVNAACDSLGTAGVLPDVTATPTPPTPSPASSLIPATPAQDADPLSTCSGWLQAPVQPGQARLVACAQADLTRYFAVGAPSDSHAGLSIAGDAGDLSADPGPPAVGLFTASHLSTVSIVASKASTSIITLQTADATGTITAATFADVNVRAGDRLHAVASASGRWTLVDDAGRPVANATAVVQQQQ